MPIPSVKHGRPNQRRRDSTVMLASSSGHSGVIGLVVDPEREGTDQIVHGAFGDAGLRFLHLTQAAMPGSFVAMVGRIRREPARVAAYRPGDAEVVVDAAFDMAQQLGDTSTWIVNLPDEQKAAMLAMLAARTATAGPMQ